VAAVASRQARDMVERNRSDHAIGNGHRAALLLGLAHDVAMDEGSIFIETKDAAGKALAEAHKGMVQTRRALSFADLLDALAQFANDDA